MRKMVAEELSNSLEFTPTWVVAGVCFVIVFISLCAERSLHKLGKLLHSKKQEALYQALEKLKEELMLLGFISLLLTVFQSAISQICIPSHISYDMLPCERPRAETIPHHHGRRLLAVGSSLGNCGKGKAPLLSLEALHHLHIFIFVLAVVHVIFCVTTMLLGGARIRQWKHWEDSIKRDDNISKRSRFPLGVGLEHYEFLKRAQGFWKQAAVVSWMIAFFKQFYGSVTKSDYIALRQGFIKKHVSGYQDFDFHKYMVRTLEVDFRKIVGISWYLWLFVVLFLLLNLDGWHTYFWLSFLPLILLLLVGAKLEHIIIRLAQENKNDGTLRVKPSDEYFWFKKPRIVLILIHFILFQNSFEIAFFFWILSTYGFRSCIMEKVGYIIPRLLIGVIVQVLCSYSLLPLYALVTQMGDTYKEGMITDKVRIHMLKWLEEARSKHASRTKPGPSTSTSTSKWTQLQKLETELSEIVQVTEQPEPAQIVKETTVVEGATAT